MRLRRLTFPAKSRKIKIVTNRKAGMFL